MKTKIDGFEIECTIEEFKALTKTKPKPKPKLGQRKPKLGQRRKKKIWTMREIELVKQVYTSPRSYRKHSTKIKGKTLVSLSKRLNRRPKDVCTKAFRLGLTNKARRK